MSDLIKRQDALDALLGTAEFIGEENVYAFVKYVIAANKKISELPPAQPECIRCKDCKHFELNKPYVIQGIPVLGNEVCNAWGNGCKTSQDGFCFLAERKE